MGMKRERTVMLPVSDEQKKQEYTKIMTEKTQADKKETQEQKKQEEMVSRSYNQPIRITDERLANQIEN